jgi:hypothetical protein
MHFESVEKDTDTGQVNKKKDGYWFLPGGRRGYDFKRYNMETFYFL